ncbi:hypothetical protein Taro_025739 [Colocasia esculenta]|uniref:BED-type domain-containing protein n=1 Tax=Colocasia esculenta TaxID=4460 RepID=A0A843VP69_COLES|nr:hypothetical protein [Colocasia esculenta]
MAAEGGASQSSSNPPNADLAWAHCTIVDMGRRKVQCKYCNRVLSGGVWRLKQHLAGIKGEVAPCLRVSSEKISVEHRKQVEGPLRKRTIADVLAGT